MKDKRPVNLDLASMRFPITAYASGLHRASGVFNFIGIAVLLWMLDASLQSEQGFDSVVELLASPIAKLVVWAVVAGLIYHTVAGVKHLIMDLGIGETMEGGTLGAQLVLVVSMVLIVMAGVWIW